KLGRAAYPALRRIGQTQEGVRRPVQMRGGQQTARAQGGGGRDGAAECGNIVPYHVVPALVGGGDGFEHLAEGGAAPPRLRRKVGAAPEGRAVRVEEHGQRPAALLP